MSAKTVQHITQILSSSKTIEAIGREEPPNVYLCSIPCQSPYHKMSKQRKRGIALCWLWSQHLRSTAAELALSGIRVFVSKRKRSPFPGNWVQHCIFQKDKYRISTSWSTTLLTAGFIRAYFFKAVFTR